MATDGLWDYLPEQEAVDIVASCLPEGRQKEAAERLVRRALELAAEVGFYLSCVGNTHSPPLILCVSIQESGMSLQDLQALPPGRHRRNRHDDTTAVVVYF